MAAGHNTVQQAEKGTRALVELLARMKVAQYRPNQEEMKALGDINRQILTNYVAGTLLGALPGLLAYRFWRPRTFFKRGFSALSAGVGLAYGGPYAYTLTYESTLKTLLRLEGSPLQGELVAILREQDPNHPALVALTAKERMSGAMWDEHGERSYARLPPADLASEPDSGRFDWRPETGTPSDNGSKGRNAIEELREKIRGDLEKRRQQSGASSSGGARSGANEGGWEREESTAGSGFEERARDEMRGWQETRTGNESSGDALFTEPLDLAVGADSTPTLGAAEEGPDHQKRLSQMSRQERREHLRELAVRREAEGDTRSGFTAPPQGLETQPSETGSRPGMRTHNPPPVRLGIAGGFGVLGWKS